MEELVVRIVNLPEVARSTVLNYIPLLELLLLESREGLWGLSHCISVYLNAKVFSERTFQCSNIEHITYLLLSDHRRGHGHMAKLKNIDLSGCPITDKLLAFFGKCNTLRSINLSHCAKLTMVLISIITHQRDVQVLDIQNCQLLTNSLPAIQSLQSLEHLSLANTRIASVDCIRSLEKLKFIEFGPHWSQAPMPVTELLKETQHLLFLEVLSLYNMVKYDGTDEIIEHQLEKHEKLKTIFVYSCEPDLVLALRRISANLNIKLRKSSNTNIQSINCFSFN